MAIWWMRMHLGVPPPMNFFTMRDGVDLPAALSAAIDRLLMLKSVASESGEGSRIAALDAFIGSETAWAREAVRTVPKPGADLRNEAEALFRQIVKG
jgi:predicted nucleotidyltransferase